MFIPKRQELSWNDGGDKQIEDETPLQPEAVRDPRENWEAFTFLYSFSGNLHVFFTLIYETKDDNSKFAMFPT